MSANAPPGFEPIEEAFPRAVLDVFVAAAEHATGKPLLGFDSSTQHFALRYVGGMVGFDPEVRKIILKQMIIFGATDLASMFEAFLTAVFSILGPELSLEKAAELSSSSLCALEALCREAGSATAPPLGETVN